MKCLTKKDYDRVGNSNRYQIFCVLIPRQKAIIVSNLQEDGWNSPCLTDIDQINDIIPEIKKSFEIICKKE